MDGLWNMNATHDHDGGVVFTGRNYPDLSMMLRHALDWLAERRNVQVFSFTWPAGTFA